MNVMLPPEDGVMNLTTGFRATTLCRSPIWEMPRGASDASLAHAKSPEELKYV